MDSINIPTEMFYFLLGNYIVEEKKKQGFVLRVSIDETLFKISVGLFVHSFSLSQNENID
jgi:hypothetical protein